MEQNGPSAENLGARIAALRLLSDLSLEDLAERSGLTKSFLSKLERGLSQPSIATVLKLSKAFGVPSGKLLGGVAQADDVLVVRRNERVPFSRAEGRAGYAYEAIAPHRSDRSMTPFVMRPPLSPAQDMDLVTHAGEEFIFVIRGRMELVLAGRTLALGAGDSVYFAASIPHRSRSLGRVPAEALVVVSVPAPAGQTRRASKKRASLDVEPGQA